MKSHLSDKCLLKFLLLFSEQNETGHNVSRHQVQVTEKVSQKTRNLRKGILTFKQHIMTDAHLTRTIFTSRHSNQPCIDRIVPCSRIESCNDDSTCLGKSSSLFFIDKKIQNQLITNQSQNMVGTKVLEIAFDYLCLQFGR